MCTVGPTANPLSSQVLQLVASQNINAVVVKPTSRPADADSSSVYVVCVDGSMMSQACFNACLKLMKEKDKVHVIHIMCKKDETEGKLYPL